MFFIENKLLYLFNWLGWNALEQAILSSSDLTTISEKLSDFKYIEKLHFLAWILNRNSEKTNYSDAYKNILDELWNTFPEQIPYDDLVTFIGFARGHMQKLTWSGMWLFKDIIQPLLDNKRISFNDAFRIWIKDFIEIFKLEKSRQSLFFNSQREGNLVNICAYLWANSSTSFQLSSLKEIGSILVNQQRIIQQPLASTSNWSRWNEALNVSMWILAYAKLCSHYLNQLGIKDNEQLNTLLTLSYNLTTVRPLEEWDSENELIKFVEWIENLLINQK